MQKTTFIYALCEPGTRTVRYIGKADKPKKRLRGHLNYNSIKTETHLGRWLRKLVAAGVVPNLVILAEVPSEGWQKEEIRYIQAARILGLDLTNGTDGGDGGLNPSPETLRHMSEAHLGQIHTPESNAKRSATMVAHIKIHGSPNTGRKASAKTRAKMSAAHSGENNPMFGKPGPNKGVPHSPETCAAISKALTGKTQSETHRLANSESHKGKNAGPENHFFGEKHTETTKATIRVKRALQTNCRGPSAWSAKRRAAFELQKQRDQEIEWALAPYTLE